VANPLLRDRDVEFVLYELNHVERLCALPAFAEHSKETFDLFLEAARRLAREVLYPAYKPMDEEPPRFSDGKITVHPRMKAIWPQLVALDLIAATRPHAVGGQQLPLSVATLANAYLMAANLSAYGYVGLTAGAAHLIEAFGDDSLKRDYMARLYSGEWTGTMALTEPQAGSSLSDVRTRATPTAEGHYLLKGSKIFISGADHDLTENVVNLTLARIDGAPAGLKGVSLFVVPKRRLEDGRLVANDVQTAGMIHKIGWRGLPSLALELGTDDDCRGWLVGEPNQGIGYMFQMMNEARIMVGMNGVATASVAYHEALAYAQVRTQGRSPAAKNPAQPQVPIIEHADVRRMLLKQKAIVEGGLALIAQTALYADLAAHAAGDEERRRALLLLELLTPIAKSFPAERGFEANALAVQVHGGYGYSSEFLPEAWLRDQKLNTIHEGTTGIQGLDLVRKVLSEPAGLRALDEELARAAPELRELYHRLPKDPARLVLHATDFLEAFSILVVGWQWQRMARAAEAALARGGDEAFYRGKLQAAEYWRMNEVTRVAELIARIERDDSYAQTKPEWL
jgi:butyryl-CoA dehydrogenase